MAGIPGKLVGTIDIYDKYTFVEVPKSFKDQFESDKVFLIPTDDKTIKPIRVIFEGE